MIRLLQIELNKLRMYRAFWVLTIMYFVGLAGTLLSIQGVFNALLDENVPPYMRGGLAWDFYSLPGGWHYMSWIASLFNFLLPVIIVIVVSAEFTNKTVRQNIINGMSRMEWMTGKLLLIGFISLLSTAVLFIVTVFMGLIHSDMSQGIELFSQTGYLIGYFIQTAGYLMVATLLSILIRNTGVIIGIMSIYSLFLEKVISLPFPREMRDYFPLASMNNLVRIPFDELINGADQAVLPVPFLICALLYIVLFAGIGYWLLNRRDL
jgi:ABC-type transport system involved in multi-copper enzyme maturation permease subunit